MALHKRSHGSVAITISQPEQMEAALCKRVAAILLTLMGGDSAGTDDEFMITYTPPGQEPMDVAATLIVPVDRAFIVCADDEEVPEPTSRSGIIFALNRSTTGAWCVSNRYWLYNDAEPDTMNAELASKLYMGLVE